MTSTLEIDADTPWPVYLSPEWRHLPRVRVRHRTPEIVYVAPAGALPGYSSRPAAPGDIVELYATGCGATSPAAPDGVVLPTVYPAANLAAFKLTIAGKGRDCSVLRASSARASGKLNIQIPSGLVGGNQLLVLCVNGATSQPNVTIALLRRVDRAT